MRFPVVANINAGPNMEAGAVTDLLFRQMFSPVLWEDCVKTMVGRGVELFIEVGPQKVLTNMMKRIVPDIPCHHVETMAEVDAVRGVLA